MRFSMLCVLYAKLTGKNRANDHNQPGDWERASTLSRRRRELVAELVLELELVVEDVPSPLPNPKALKLACSASTIARASGEYK